MIDKYAFQKKKQSCSVLRHVHRPFFGTYLARVTCTRGRPSARTPTHIRTSGQAWTAVHVCALAQRQQRRKVRYKHKMEAIPTQERTHARALAHTHAHVHGLLRPVEAVCAQLHPDSPPLPLPNGRPTSAPGLRPHPFWDCAHSCAATHPHLRRDWTVRSHLGGD